MGEESKIVDVVLARIDKLEDNLRSEIKESRRESVAALNSLRKEFKEDVKEVRDYVDRENVETRQRVTALEKDTQSMKDKVSQSDTSMQVFKSKAVLIGAAVGSVATMILSGVIGLIFAKIAKLL